jgi:SAM-dependent methyltransferase
LWADLLKLVYGRAVESDRLWFQHTFLVIVAKCIARAVMRLVEDDPKRLLSGEAFAAAGISGAVESDFFDWVAADPEGEALVRRIVNHVRRFRLAEVESDVLKILYESLIDREERHGLGEYYTPDWLAAKIVRRAVDRPLEQRVLDPGCGSGTFLFHAVRNFLAEAEAADMPRERRAAEAASQIAGMDIHPVAIIIARVTYLLALSPALTYRAGGLSIPAYLGDTMQLSISEFMAGKELTIRVPPPPAGAGGEGGDNGNGREQLDFPETFCRDPALFDKAIEQMRTGSLEGLSRRQIEAALHRIMEQHYRADVFPIAPIRIVYAKAGTLPAACVLRDVQAVIDHMLYWAAPTSDEEAHYLAAILNSETARSRAEQYQSRGPWGARHFDKVMFNLPIPRFDPANSLHGALADAAAEAERVAAAVELPESIHFQQARRLIRMALTEAGLAPRIDAFVAQLLDGGQGSM